MNIKKETVVEAILRGSMNGDITWYPTDVVVLRRRLAALDNGIKATPFYHQRQNLIRDRKKIAKKISHHDYRKSKQFFTEITVTDTYATPGGFRFGRRSRGSLTMTDSLDLHVYVNFEKHFRFEVKELDGRELWKPKEDDIDSRLLMLPSLIPNNVVTHRADLVRYRYEPGD